MPKQNVTAPFNWNAGGKVVAYKTGEQNLPPEVAAHASKHGFVAKPATATAKQPAAPEKAEPAAKQ